MEGLSFLPWVTDTCAMVWARREAAPQVLGVLTGHRRVGRALPGCWGSPRGAGM